MQIKGIESMTSQELAREVASGGKFVIYHLNYARNATRHTDSPTSGTASPSAGLNQL